MDIIYLKIIDSYYKLIDFDTIDVDAHVFCTILEYCEGPDLA